MKEIVGGEEVGTHSPAARVGSTGKPSRKERAEETRARLVHAAITLFSERGYHETTVQSISEGAGVAKGTFFVHFATKDILLAGVIAKYIAAAQLARETAVRTGSTPVAAISAMLSALAEQAGRSPSLMRALYAATLSNAELAAATRRLYDLIREILIEEIERGQRDGTFRQDLNAREAGLSLASLYVGVSLEFSITPEAPALWPILEPLLHVVLKSFASAPVNR